MKRILGPITHEFINSLTKTTTAITPTQQISNLSSVMFTKLLNKGIQSEDVSRLQNFLQTKPEIYPQGW